MDKFIGWLVKVEDENGKLVPVSAPFATKEAAETYVTLYKKHSRIRIPQSKKKCCTIKEKVLHNRA